jgi:hypothetical protein
MGEPYANAAAPIFASGTAAAPGAGASFVTTASPPPAGWYELIGWFAITGAVETAALNVELGFNNVAAQTKFPSGMGVATVIEFRIPQILLDGTHNVALAAVAGATVSTVYTGSFVLTEVAD